MRQHGDHSLEYLLQVAATELTSILASSKTQQIGTRHLYPVSTTDFFHFFDTVWQFVRSCPEAER
jgi:hypothetical protein